MTEEEMKLFLQILLIASSVLLVVAVLLHRGRGGGLSSLFGGGMQSSLAGSSVAEKNLDRITLLLGAVWLISIIGLGLLLKVWEHGRAYWGVRRRKHCEDSWLAVTRFAAPELVPVLPASRSVASPRPGAGFPTGVPMG